ncbi:hypothetical protein PTTW11_09896 [Pyrenophora teres f. teres]|uniref:Uncharacterized protein n=1 Tax=Pyrenophora teres f. teres TaxID=97479 RepID=A0A6S6WD96_9PLEO|nr:hypothetical protein PTTW11_09896 [Pyrenophora teres f. teres]
MKTLQILILFATSSTVLAKYCPGGVMNCYYSDNYECHINCWPQCSCRQFVTPNGHPIEVGLASRECTILSYQAGPSCYE